MWVIPTSMGPLEQSRPIHDQFVVYVDGMVAHGRLAPCFVLIVVTLSFAVGMPNAPTNTVSKKKLTGEHPEGRLWEFNPFLYSIRNQGVGCCLAFLDKGRRCQPRLCNSSNNNKGKYWPPNSNTHLPLGQAYLLWTPAGRYWLWQMVKRSTGMKEHELLHEKITLSKASSYIMKISCLSLFFSLIVTPSNSKVMSAGGGGSDCRVSTLTLWQSNPSMELPGQISWVQLNLLFVIY
jgi:hypothetical protein